jgi:VIT1/CCC1 family predicted Fe2+/Mn2+ transporter
VITLFLLTLIVVLLAFPVTSPWREAIAITCVVLVALLWLNWTGAITIHGRWV